MESSFTPQVRAAKEKAKVAFPGAAIGLTWHNGREAIKVNLTEALPENAEAPYSIDGFPVVLQVVGKIRKQIDVE
jgi:hypothetical protein